MQSTSSPRSSQGLPKEVDLFCTSCDTQIGTYENEWVRLTSSYVIPKANGTKFGLVVAAEHRTVDGKEATTLHGCDLSEASCYKCSKAVGHFCRNAPGKLGLVGRYIYKLSKTHLKLSRTATHVEFNLMFGAPSPQDRPRSMFTAPPRPVQSPSPYLHGVRNDAARKSVGPPSSHPNSELVIDSTLTAPTPTPPTNRETSPRSAEPTREEKADLQGITLILQKLEEHENKLSKISESINDWKIQNGMLLTALLRSSSHALTQRDTTGALEIMMDDFEFMVNAAYEARSGKGELEILRAENEGMRTKLHTIALAMGSAAGNLTPASQPLSSPMTNSSTPSVLGKRKRMDTRSRHSLLHNEVSFTDDGDLNDQSGLYAASNAANFITTPARQSEKLPSPLSSSTRVGQQSEQSHAPTDVSTAKPVAVSTAGGQTPAKTSAPMLTPPNSSSVEQHVQESGLTEPDHFWNTKSKRFGNTASEVNGSINQGSVDFVENYNMVGMAAVERQEEGTTSSGVISGSQRGRNPTPNISAADDANEPGYVASVTEQREQSRDSPPESEMTGLHSGEAGACATNASRRKTTSVMLEEIHSRLDINTEKNQQRETTNTHPETVGVSHTKGDESNRVMRQQHRMTRAVVPQMGHIHETGDPNSYVEGRIEMSAEVEADHWRPPLSMTLTNEEEREELFERSQSDQHSLPTNGINKENEHPYHADAADGTQSKQWSRRNRDPNRPKRLRRKPEEIERKYKCLFPGCTKAYGLLPHLNTHISDNNHGERWGKADYLEANKNQANGLDNGMEEGDSLDLDRLAAERNAGEAVAALKRNQERVDRVEKLRQRDRMAKEAMEREEMMELMNGV